MKSAKEQNRSPGVDLWSVRNEDCKNLELSTFPGSEKKEEIESQMKNGSSVEKLCGFPK